jgi:hypothetical protein
MISKGWQKFIPTKVVGWNLLLSQFSYWCSSDGAGRQKKSPMLKLRGQKEMALPGGCTDLRTLVPRLFTMKF